MSCDNAIFLPSSDVTITNTEQGIRNISKLTKKHTTIKLSFLAILKESIKKSIQEITNL